MERLTGLDAGFLYMETPTQHMHTLKIAILDPSTVPGGYSFQGVKEVLAERLHLLPPFRRRLVEVPFNLHHPVWIEDPDFDLDFHVRRVGVPAPDAIAPAPPARPWRPEAIPSGAQLLGQAIVAMLRALVGVPALVKRTLGGFRAVARRRRSGAVSPPLPFSAPKTAFNTALTPH